MHRDNKFSLLIAYVITNVSITKYLQQQLKIISLLNGANELYKMLMRELEILSRSQHRVLFYFSYPFLNLLFPSAILSKNLILSTWRYFGIRQEITVTALLNPSLFQQPNKNSDPKPLLTSATNSETYTQKY